MIKNSIYLILSVLILGSCNTASSWKNENIDESVRAEIATLNTEVVEAILTKDVEKLKSISSEQLLEITDEEDLTNVLLSFSRVLKSDKRTIIDQFYTKNSDDDAIQVLLGDNYQIRFKGLNEEVFTSIFTLESKFNNEYIAGAIYGKYEDGWKLNLLKVGEYKMYGNSALDYYEKAKVAYDKGHILTAGHNTYLAFSILKPLQEIWTYNVNDEIVAFHKKTAEALTSTYKFPHEMSSVASKPRLIGFKPQMSQEGAFPELSYVTDIDVTDSVSLSKEYLQIVESLDEEFKGLKEGHKVLIFKACDGVPGGQEDVNSFSFVHRF